MSRNFKKLAVIVRGYPSVAEPTSGAFVKEIIHSFSRRGIHCMVVQPISVLQARDRNGYPFHEMKKVENGGVIEVYRPSYWAIPIVFWGARLGVLNPNWLKFKFFCHSVLNVFKKAGFQPDGVYGHFLYFAGGCAIDVAKALNVPSFIGVGEGEFWSIRPMGFDRAKRHLCGATGLIPNATHLMRKVSVELGIPEQQMTALPNGVDLYVFKPQNRKDSRQQLGLPLDQFIVGSVGSFLYKKGLVRVAQAIEGLEGVVGIFAGSGPEAPVGENVLWSKPVSHDQLPIMLSACDIFVLPTLIEGCCNALIEAMACGLPIISSDSEYTEDLLTDACAIRIDPLDVGAIRNAIITLRDDPERRQRMANAALKHAQGFDINVRARRVVEFMSRLARM